MGMSPKKAMQSTEPESGRGAARLLTGTLAWMQRECTQEKIDAAQRVLPSGDRIERNKEGEDECEE